jgi:transcription initiation factor TFIIH subunit 3
MEQDESSVVVILLDLNPYSWAHAAIHAEKQRRQRKSVDDDEEEEDIGRNNHLVLPEVAKSICIFINAILLLHQDNHVAIVGAHYDGKPELIFPPSSDENNGLNIQQCLFRAIEKVMMIHDDSSTIMEEDKGISVNTTLNPAVSLGLCYINRVMKRSALGEAGIQRRMLILTASEPSPREFVALTNGIFAAGKLSLMIDVCDCSPFGATILFQLANNTGGIFVNNVKNDPGALTQYLLSMFLCDGRSRKYLSLPPQPPSDLRAACFCHENKLVEIGWTCSVCLSVFCTSDLSKCPTCGSRVTIKRGVGSSAAKT